MLVGALIFVLGIDLTIEAIWDTRKRVNRTEYITIWAIAIGMTLCVKNVSAPLPDSTPQVGLCHRPVVWHRPRLRLLRGAELPTASHQDRIQWRNGKVHRATTKITKGVHPASRVADVRDEAPRVP